MSGTARLRRRGPRAGQGEGACKGRWVRVGIRHRVRVRVERRVLSLLRVRLHRAQRAVARHAAARGGGAEALAELNNPRLVARDQPVALLAREPAVLEPVHVPALEAAAEDGRDGLDGLSDDVDGAVGAAEAVERARVGEMLEHAVVVHVARDQVHRPIDLDRRAAARRGGLADRVLRRGPRAVVERGSHAADARHREGAVVLAPKRLAAQLVARAIEARVRLFQPRRGGGLARHRGVAHEAALSLSCHGATGKLAPAGQRSHVPT
eukprot:1278668-Prymnesium_polylepis.1